MRKQIGSDPITIVLAPPITISSLVDNDESDEYELSEPDEAEPEKTRSPPPGCKTKQAKKQKLAYVDTSPEPGHKDPPQKAVVGPVRPSSSVPAFMKRFSKVPGMEDTNPKVGKPDVPAEPRRKKAKLFDPIDSKSAKVDSNLLFSNLFDVPSKGVASGSASEEPGEKPGSLETMMKFTKKMDELESTSSKVPTPVPKKGRAPEKGKKPPPPPVAEKPTRAKKVV